MRCGFCARGECWFGADCRRTKRVVEFVKAKLESVSPADLKSDASDQKVFHFGDETAGAAAVSGS